MARAKLWAEAQEEYLLYRNIEKREKLVKLSDNELSNLYYKAIEEKNLKEDADKFTRKYCMQFK